MLPELSCSGLIKVGLNWCPSPYRRSTIKCQHAYCATPFIGLFSSTLLFKQNNNSCFCLRCDCVDLDVFVVVWLCQDYQARGSVREYDGFPPILEMLKSEYAIIQKLALLTLDRLMQDGGFLPSELIRSTIRFC